MKVKGKVRFQCECENMYAVEWGQGKEERVDIVGVSESVQGY